VSRFSLRFTNYATNDLCLSNWAAPSPGPGRKTLVSTDGALGFPRWRRDGKELYYLNAENRLMAVQVSTASAQLVVGTEQPLFEARVKTSGRYPYDVSADGQRFLINTSLSSADAPPVTLVVNWLAGNQEVKGVA
jgi:eukaryotic-like serine/threonine-protein kinase